MLEIISNPVFILTLSALCFICMTTALWGSLLLVSKKSLLGESLSHASYPGILLGVLIFDGIFSELGSSLAVLFFGSLAAVIGFYCISFFIKKLNLTEDSSLSFVLVLFFGLGIVFSSYAQSSSPLVYVKINSYLYGQAATLSDVETIVSFFIFLFSIGFVILFYKSILSICFDYDYAKVSGIKVTLVNNLILFFLSLIVVLGMRAVGVVLISSMIVAPSLAAKQFTNRFSLFILLSVVFGALSGCLGALLSLILSVETISGKTYLPTGPLVVVISGIFVIFSLFFGVRQGVLIKLLRRKLFKISVHQENLIKVIWFISNQGQLSFTKKELISNSKFLEIFSNNKIVRFLFILIFFKGWIQKINKNIWILTSLGKEKAEKIVRLHRLWELYLVNSLDFDKEQVHPLAEEVEHVINSDLEKLLFTSLNRPSYDPHNQLIPEGGEY